ncbi:odv-e28/pif-4 [Cyclophragma undans nucleopolyhedrovirus]|uniref:Odv-e28/pif-4 n=1 Tax=Cyclophragma undans nucleopolyhedrovirus TaxID=1906244 RepID=A0A288QB34_9ABAC|nr:odv-e28/pif-4 [Cyclophragma undans nucleopolyhedrovirus]AOT85531.1 odv-e28/pif-4 [Cyclophragma undans nucleopolyhedrovirus]
MQKSLLSSSQSCPDNTGGELMDFLICPSSSLSSSSSTAAATWCFAHEPLKLSTNVLRSCVKFLVYSNNLRIPVRAFLIINVLASCKLLISYVLSCGTSLNKNCRMVSIVFVAIVLAMFLFLYLIVSIRNHHPFLNKINKLVRDYDNTLLFGTYIQIYDLSTPASVERLFIIAPENVVLYNFGKTLYYYLDSANVFCPNEFSVTTFTPHSIRTINGTGVYSTACTAVSSLTLLEHFVTLKNNVPDHTLVLNVVNEQIQFSILDIINYLIYNGYVFIE